MCILSTSAEAAKLAYPATISLDRTLSAGPITGHLVARSVRAVREGKRWEAAVERLRRVLVDAEPKNGQRALNPAREERLNIGRENKRNATRKDLYFLPANHIISI